MHSKQDEVLLDLRFDDVLISTILARRASVARDLEYR